GAHGVLSAVGDDLGGRVSSAGHFNGGRNHDVARNGGSFLGALCQFANDLGRSAWHGDVIHGLAGVLSLQRTSVARHYFGGGCGLFSVNLRWAAWGTRAYGMASACPTTASFSLIGVNHDGVSFG